MTVKELIEKLQTFDENLTVVVGYSEEDGSPIVEMVEHPTSLGYWDNHELKSIPPNTKYIVL